MRISSCFAKSNTRVAVPKSLTPLDLEGATSEGITSFNSDLKRLGFFLFIQVFNFVCEYYFSCHYFLNSRFNLTWGSLALNQKYSDLQ